MKWLWRILGLSLLLVLLTACPFNSGPSVTVTLQKSELQPLESTTASASAPTTDPVTFSWSTSGGTVTPDTGKAVTYTAPAEEGIYTITARVSDASIAPGARRVYVLSPLAVGTSLDTPLVSDRVSGFGMKLYRLDIPAALTTDLIYVELEGANLKLTLWDAAKNPVRESSSSSFFSAVGSDFFNDLSTQGVTTSRICLGPCVIFENTNSGSGGHVYAVVETPGLEASFKLYAYGASYTDDTEPENNTCPTAANVQAQGITINPKDEYLGAIETVEDVDCFGTSDPVSSIKLSSFADTTIKVAATVYDLISNEALITLSVGEGENSDTLTFSPARPVKVVVTSANGRAAASKNSRYLLSF